MAHRCLEAANAAAADPHPYIICKENEPKEIDVRMTSDEFLEFMAYKQDKSDFAKRLTVAQKKMQAMARMVGHAVEPVGDRADEFRIISQGHMCDLWAAAGDVLE